MQKQQLTPLEDLQRKMQQHVVKYIRAQGATREAWIAALGALDLAKVLVSDPKWFKQVKHAHQEQAQQAAAGKNPAMRGKKKKA